MVSAYENIKPQIKAPRVTSLQSRASGGRIHVCPRRAYVDVYSAQSVFYRSHSRVNNLLSAFISVHPRLINCVGGV